MSFNAFKSIFTLDPRSKFNVHRMHIRRVHTSNLVFRQCVLDAHWVNPPLEVDWNQIGTKLIFVYSLNNSKIMHGYALHEQQHCRSFCLGHHTHCICHLRYEPRCAIMLGCYWLDAVDKETTSTWSHVVHRNSNSMLSTTSNTVRQIIGRTLVCVSIHLECWLDKPRVEIATWAVARQQQFSCNSVSNFWQCECDQCGFNSHLMRIEWMWIQFAFKQD